MEGENPTSIVLKENHEILGPNIKLFKQHLKNSEHKIEYDKNILGEYGNKFKEQKTDNIIEKPLVIII